MRFCRRRSCALPYVSQLRGHCAESDRGPTRRALRIQPMGRGPAERSPWSKESGLAPHLHSAHVPTTLPPTFLHCGRVVSMHVSFPDFVLEQQFTLSLPLPETAAPTARKANSAKSKITFFMSPPSLWIDSLAPGTTIPVRAASRQWVFPPGPFDSFWGRLSLRGAR